MKEITRIFEFDCAHRVMNERVKCFNLHGHRFRAEITFEYFSEKEIGYTIDFKEIKRVIGAFIDTYLDHACLLNPKDIELIDLCRKNGWRLWLMGFGSDEDINPSAERIAQELYTLSSVFFSMAFHGIHARKVRLYETPNCYVEITHEALELSGEELSKWILWRKALGDVEYDARCVKDAD